MFRWYKLYSSVPEIASFSEEDLEYLIDSFFHFEWEIEQEHRDKIKVWLLNLELGIVHPWQHDYIVKVLIPK